MFHHVSSILIDVHHQFSLCIVLVERLGSGLSAPTAPTSEDCSRVSLPHSSLLQHEITWRCIKTPCKFKYPQNCYRFFFLLSFLRVLGFSTYWKVYIKKIYLLELRQEDLPLKLRQEDLLSKASSRRFAF